MTPRTILLSGLLAALVARPAVAEERPRPAPADRRGFDWTGGYLGVTTGAASGGGRTRAGRAGEDADRYPPARTRTRP